MHPFEQKLVAEWPSLGRESSRIVVAVSGGADSVALARALMQLRSPSECVVCHFHHGLRPSADRDEQFVRQLASQWGSPLHVGFPATPLASQAAGQGLEAAARQARYDFLLEAAERLGSRYLVTAHTADDQAETILHRIIRGTGIAGLAGIRRVRVLSPACTLIRPLLAIRRPEVIQYLTDVQQPYCFDESNLDQDFTRNRIRLDLLPKIAQDYNQQIVDALLRLGTLAREAQDLVDERACELEAVTLRRRTANSVELSLDALPQQEPYLVRELLIRIWNEQNWPAQAMSFEQWTQLASLATNAEGGVRAKVFPGNIRVAREGDVLSLVREPPEK